MSDGPFDHLRTERDGGIALVIIDSTSARNAMHADLARELLDLAIALTDDDDVRCIALTGTGDAFSVGADLRAFAGDETDATTLRRIASTFHDAISQLHRSGMPVVAGVNGVAAGAGFSLALSADIVLISDAARLDYAYPRVGLTADGGATFFLPRLVGLRRAKEIALLDEPIGPERAVELGLATEVVPAGEFDERLAEIAGRIADGPTWALGTIKRLLTGSFERDLEGQLAAETDAMAGAAHTEDYARGHAAFFDDRDPSFTGS